MQNLRNNFLFGRTVLFQFFAKRSRAPVESSIEFPDQSTDVSPRPRLLHTNSTTVNSRNMRARVYVKRNRNLCTRTRAHPRVEFRFILMSRNRIRQPNFTPHVCIRNESKCALQTNQCFIPRAEIFITSPKINSTCFSSVLPEKLPVVIVLLRGSVIYILWYYNGEKWRIFSVIAGDTAISRRVSLSISLRLIHSLFSLLLRVDIIYFTLLFTVAPLCLRNFSERAINLPYTEKTFSQINYSDEIRLN